MDSKITGSWLIHHTNKLQGVTNQNGFEATFLAGKAGILLSAISGNWNFSVSNEKLEVLAQASNINLQFELPALKEVLRKQGLIDVGQTGISVLGVTTSSALQHTANIFNGRNPKPTEQAAIALAELASIAPISTKLAAEKIGDEFKLPTNTVSELLKSTEEIGFADFEKIDDAESLIFNGNLFRRENTRKAKLVLDSLSSQDQAKITEFNALLKGRACLLVEEAIRILGQSLFDKVSAIALYDINVVSNSAESTGFVTMPSAFSKFSTSMIEDAFDLAKAFISSITYGIVKSYHERGRIRMVEALLHTLVRGEPVGPVDAIAQDYKILELKGVVQVYQGSKKGRSGPMMKLLKREVGELALQAIMSGDISEHSLKALPKNNALAYKGPEQNREEYRRKQRRESPKSTNDMLNILRTGKI